MTAPNNNNPKDPNSPPTPPSPIQPGQFVVTGEEDVFKQPPPPEAAHLNPSPSPSPPTPETLNPAGVQTAAAPNIPASEAGPPQQVMEPPQPQLAATQPSAPGTDQPNPTPYAPPPESPASQPAQPSVISKLRKVLIVLIVLTIIGGTVAAAWFFVLDKNNLIGKLKDKLTNKSPQVVQETEVETPPSPPPKRTVGGFADLPAATSESQATAPATKQEEEE